MTVCVDSGFLHLFSFGKVHTLSLSSRHEATGTLGLPRAEFEKLLKCCAFCESADSELVKNAYCRTVDERKEQLLKRAK